jgi:hypothetical protein
MRTFLVTITFFSLLLSACDRGPKAAAGFRLPEGSVDRGMAAFVELKCNDCHTVAGVKLPPPDKAPAVIVTLGGETPRVRTYGELVTSVINPSHRLARGYAPELIQADGQSRMPDYNEVMTVQQMIDLVAFLQSRYELVVPAIVH